MTQTRIAIQFELFLRKSLPAGDRSPGDAFAKPSTAVGVHTCSQSSCAAALAGPDVAAWSAPSSRSVRDRLGIAPLRRPHERRRTANAFLCVHVCAGGNQHLAPAAGLPFRAANMTIVSPLGPRCLPIGAGFQQALDHDRVALERRHHQRRHAFAVFLYRIDRCAPARSQSGIRPNIRQMDRYSRWYSGLQCIDRSRCVVGLWRGKPKATRGMGGRTARRAARDRRGRFSDSCGAGARAQCCRPGSRSRCRTGPGCWSRRFPVVNALALVCEMPPALQPPASASNEHVGHVVVLMLIGVPHVCAVKHQRVVEQVSITVGYRLQLLGEVPRVSRCDSD